MAGGYRGGDAPIAPYPEGKTIAVIMVGGPTKGTSSCWQCEDGERRDFPPHSTCCERERRRKIAITASRSRKSFLCATGDLDLTLFLECLLDSMLWSSE